MIKSAARTPQNTADFSDAAKNKSTFQRDLATFQRLLHFQRFILATLHFMVCFGQLLISFQRFIAFFSDALMKMYVLATFGTYFSDACTIQRLKCYLLVTFSDFLATRNSFQRRFLFLATRFSDELVLAMPFERRFPFLLIFSDVLATRHCFQRRKIDFRGPATRACHSY